MSAALLQLFRQAKLPLNLAEVLVGSCSPQAGSFIICSTEDSTAFYGCAVPLRGVTDSAAYLQDPVCLSELQHMQ